MASATYWLEGAWQWFVHLDGTRFVESGLVALAGAYFGAKTAQGTADRNRFRDDIVEEIRDTNAAITLSFAICNSMMAIKRQHLRSLRQVFDKDKKDLIEFERKRKTGELQGNKAYEIKVDIRYLPVPNPPTETLQAHVLDRLSIVGRPLNLAVHVVESATALGDSIANRNEQIKAFREVPGPRDRAFMGRYFGLPTAQGELDEIYSTTLDAMVLHNDCVIFFTYMLCGDLQEHGNSLVAKYKKRLGTKNLPKISKVDFSPAKADKLIPPDEEFASWLTPVRLAMRGAGGST